MTKRKLVLILTAILVGLVYFSPHIIGSHLLVDSNQTYWPFSMDGSVSQDAYEEMFAYAPKVQEVLRGNVFVREPYTYEYRNVASPNIGETFPSVIMAALSKASGSVPTAFILADLIFPMLIFLTAFSFIYLPSKNFLLSLSAAICLVFLTNLVYYLPYPTNVANYLYNHGNYSFLAFMRGFNPQISFLVFQGCYLLLFLALKTKQRRFQILAITSSGLLFYTYIYYWSCYIVSVGILFVLLFYQKKYNQILQLTVIIFGALVLGSYYFCNLYLFRSSSLYHEFVLGLAPGTNSLVPVYFWRYFIISLAFIIWPRKRRVFDWFIFSVLLAATISPLFLKLLIGQDLQGFHFIRRVFLPFSIIGIFVILNNFFKMINLSLITKKRVFAGALAIAIFSGLTQQYYASKNSFRANALDNGTRQLFNWLNNKTIAQSVVGTPDFRLDFAISASTHNYVFISPIDNGLMPKREVNDRYHYLSNLLGVKDGDLPRQQLNYVNFDENVSFSPRYRYRLDYLVVPKTGEMSKIFRFAELKKKFQVIYENRSYFVIQL